MRKGAQKGKSHSKRPVEIEKPSWVNITPEELEKNIVELAKKGVNKAEIGQILRDEYGIPLVKALLGRKVSAVLAQAGVQRRIPEDLEALITHADNTATHLMHHPADKASLRGLEITESKIHRLVKYYKRRGLLSPEWKYQQRAATFS
ncbi:MAG: 30S ribosomal protein S15 [Candidatus Marsarchaeota archaeon]|nr:30S ribosomal protein S15 [Candidatus Marsarchaeota archaeon]